MIRRSAAVAVFAAALLLAGCGASGDAQEATPAPTASATPEELTCESMVSSDFADQLADLGWTAREDVFRIGEHEIDGGIQCTWGDPANGAEVAQIYGWAEIDADAATEMEQYLAGQGWTVEEGDGVVYVTEDPEYAMYQDDDGYGMTYEFGDGWVKLADTKASLGVVTWRG
ncbi:hypothetical protein [Microbacterium indicum]|uniref:hypothetical protein n=1 Tax=Microbacterium indicum TaxID=358100 RepID=UPI00041595F8|nr:hypothetical protein [Microbacterium indicum]